MTTLTTLPNEILLMILGYGNKMDLLTCATVNSQLFDLATSLLWHTVHVRYQSAGTRFLNCLDTDRQRSVGGRVRHVHLESFSWNDKALMTLMQGAPLLASLVIDNGSRISDESMTQIAHHLPYLQSLQLTSTPITDASFCALGKLPKLTNLDLFTCPGVHPEVFSAHFVDSPIENLMLASWTNDDDEEEEEEEAMINLKALGRLKHLKLHGFSIGMLHKYMDTMPVNLQARISCWPFLTSIDLEACFGLKDADAVALVRRLPAGLTRLALKDAEFSDITLDAIATYQPNLRELDLSFNPELTPRGIKTLVCRCRHLVSVNLSYCQMKMQDFDEASLQCAEEVETFENTFTRLGHLDKQAIEAIRRGSESR